MYKPTSTAIACSLILFFLISSCIAQIDRSISDQAGLLIQSLSDEQQKEALYSFDDKNRTDWTFLPKMERRGLSLKKMNSNQKGLVNDFLKIHLSEMGYQKTKDVMALEQILREMDGTAIRDPELYFISFYGDPAENKIWGWSFEGHHVSVNFTLINGEISSSPTFLGSNPGEVKQGSQKGLRVLKLEEDLGLELINSMSASQKEKAIISESTYGEVVTRFDTQVNHLGDDGLSVGEFTSDQKQTLQKLLDVYVTYLTPELSKKRAKQIESEGLDNLVFAWAGATKMGKAHYYRIQGKTFLIECDNSQNDANHVHAVWRDFDGDFGRDLIKEHYHNSDHHH